MPYGARNYYVTFIHLPQYLICLCYYGFILILFILSFVYIASFILYTLLV